VCALIIALGGYLGFKTFTDQTAAVIEGFRKELTPLVAAARDDANRLKQQIDDADKEISSLRVQGNDLRGEYQALEADVKVIRDAKIRLEELTQQTASTNQQVEDLKRQVDRLTPFQPLPAACGPKPYHLSLHKIIGDEATAKIQDNGQLVFHITGDTGGVRNPSPQERVATAMAAQITAGNDGQRPAFLYLLGDLVYYSGEAENYYAQFYAPYAHYAAPIFAIPGNHDGVVLSGHPASDSLAAFMANFCASPGTRTPEAKDVARMAMTQPNSYWTLEAPYATIVGLYTNVTEGGALDDEQIAWLANELKTAPKDKALIVAMHHPIYAISSLLSGSKANNATGPMGKVLDDAIATSGRIPDAVFAAHANLYMRFSRDRSGSTIPYLVVGTGGYPNRLRMPATARRNTPTTAVRNVSLASYDDTHYGFMRVTVSKARLVGEFFTVADRSSPDSDALALTDSFALDLMTHRMAASRR